MPDLESPAFDAEVIVVAQFPPPVNGQSTVNAFMRSEIASRHKSVNVDTSPGAFDRSLGYHARRTWATLRAMFTIWRRRRSAKVLYVSVDSGLGILYNCAVLLAARAAGFHTMAHHHSYAYLIKASPWMKLLARLSGPSVTHILLCERMEKAFRAQYPGSFATVVCSNAWLPIDRTASSEGARQGPFRIGLLSNLTPEKGLHEFVTLTKSLVGQGLDVQGVLAGPIVDPEDLKRVREQVEALEGRLQYVGPAFGQDKINLLRSLDAFIFPTRYPTECLSLVLLEAQAAGLPVISYGRGCIPDLLCGPSGFSVDPGDDFETAATLLIRSWIESPELHALARRHAVERWRELSQRAKMDLTKLMQVIQERAAGRASPDMGVRA